MANNHRFGMTEDGDVYTVLDGRVRKLGQIGSLLKGETLLAREVQRWWNSDEELNIIDVRPIGSGRRWYNFRVLQRDAA